MAGSIEKMKRVVNIVFCLCFLFVSNGLSGEKPNIVFILADDLGIGDLGCYQSDSKVPTPNLDELASEGMRFTDAYCPISVCSPTRYALMTGRYPWRSWKKRGVLANWDKPMIEEGVTTLPGVLQEAGYHTGGYGKWHLGADYVTTDGKPPKGKGKFKSPGTGANLDLSAPISGGPLDRGFDEWFGFICASEQLIYDGDRLAAVVGHDLYEPPQAKGIGEYPVIPLEESLPHDTEKAIDFLNRQKESDTPFFLYFAPYVPHIPLAVEESFRGKTKAGDYGDYVHELDHYIGKLLSALEENGQAENTIVIFASDNGSQFPESGEAKHRPNAPYAGTKWTIREGGVRTPLLIRWPGVVEAGAMSDHLIGLNDMLATVASLSELDLPEDEIRDSLNFLPVLKGEQETPVRESIALCSSGGLHAIRNGKWKFIEGPGDGRSGAKGDGPQLYDLETDPKERNNIAGDHPDTVNRLRDELNSLLK